MNALIEQCRLAGIRLWVEDGTIRYDAPRGAMTPELVTALKTKRLALLDALAHPGPLPRLPRGLGGYGTPPGVPPLGDSELARQVRSMSEDGQPEPLWWRVSITDPGGRTVEVDTPSGWTLSEWAAYSFATTALGAP